MILYHIPVCPFSQRIEILLTLKARRADVQLQVIDVTRPRPAWLLEKTCGSTSLPVLEVAPGKVLKESLVIMRFLDDALGGPRIAHADPYAGAVESMLCAMEAPLCARGYEWILNQDASARADLRERMLEQYGQLDAFLRRHAPEGPFLSGSFGWAEAVFTPLFMRFWFLEYYEAFALPAEPGYARVGEWVRACVAHPAAQQVTREEIVKLYYDYARGAGNGGLLPGRARSSFALDSDWRRRPWPPRDKYERAASDEELGLAGAPA